MEGKGVFIAGGLTDEQAANEEIQTIVDKIRPQLEEKMNRTFKVFEAIRYRSQVVAGTNFFVKVKVDVDCYIHVRIYRHLPPNGERLEVSDYQVNKSLEEKIEYF
ncbi:cystatin-B-like [Physella acuta]|uniref:cystatin-B-like n=1 Tax=Physella acuta TaxID=109671 RepID=UPI0027DDAF6A|nr:cystatin-B-like [Physella acuta]